MKKLGLILSLVLLLSLASVWAIEAPSANIVVQGTKATINVTYRELVGLSDMKITLLPSTSIPINNKPPIKTTFRCGEGDYAYFMSQSLRFSGNYSFYVRVVDCAGNFREDQRNFTVIIPPPLGCGDMFLNTTLGEECDDGNTISGDGCSSFCRSEHCGNNRLDFGEVCDGSALNGFSCTSFPGYDSGALSCSNDCSRLLFSNCKASASTCGNNVIEVGEQCDTNNWGSITSCTQINDAFTGGQLTCNPATCMFETSECMGKKNAVCGNSQVEVGEQCDGSASKKCSDFDSFFGSGLTCTSNCEYSTASCQKPVTTCGDGEVNTKLNENCDGTAFLPEMDSCSDFPEFSAQASLTCKADCRLDTSGCGLRNSINETCSNGKKDLFEKDVDCGGGCGCCDARRTCSSNSECCSGFCSAGVCQEASCSDKIKNGFEAGVDCGGFCETKCALGSDCLKSTDCDSGFCAGSVCAEASCSDGVKNGLETDVDCGGTCGACSIGQECSYSSDCASQLCEYGFCGVDKVSDSDFDQIPDFWEDRYGLNKNDASDANSDFDRDGFTNLEEYFNGTDPTVFDEGGKSGVLGLVLLLVGIVLILSGAGFLVYYRLYMKPKPVRPVAPIYNNQVRAPLRQPVPAARPASKSSSLIRKLILQKKTGSQPSSQAQVKPSPAASKPNDVFEKLKGLNADAKKKK
jgi:cysteine-rich repeat protein